MSSIKIGGSGEFSFPAVAPGSYELRIEALAFDGKVQQVVADKDTDVGSIVLKVHSQGGVDIVPAEAFCYTASAVARQSNGKPVVLSTRQLDKMATHRVMPKPPQLGPMAATIDGHVLMKILVGESGAMRCAVALSGDPLLAKDLPETLSQWRFRPYTQSGRPVAVYGVLDFHFAPSDPRSVYLDYERRPR